jgi:hypothetical protein
MRVIIVFLALLFLPSAAIAKRERIAEDHFRMMDQLRKGESIDRRTVDRLYPDIAEEVLVAKWPESYRLVMTAPPNSGVLKLYFVNQLEWALGNSPEIETKRANHLGWFGGFILQALLHAYRGTGDTDFLNIFARFYDQILDRRDSVLGIQDPLHGGAVEAWSNTPKGGSGVAALTQSGRLAWVGVQFVEMVRADKLHQFSDRAAKYEKLATAALAAFDTDFVSTPKGCFYKVARLLPDKWKGEPHPFNHVSFVGAAYAGLYALTGNPEYRSRVECLAEFWRAHVTVHNGAWAWPYGATVANGTSEQTWKAGYTIVFPIEAYKRGLAFKDEDIRGLARTFLQNVVRSNDYSVRIGLDEKRTFQEIRTNKKYASWFLYVDEALIRWRYLADFCPDVAAELDKAILTRPDLFSDGWYTTGTMAEFQAYRLVKTNHRNLCK